MAVPLTDPESDPRELDDLELRLLSEAIHERYGYDFRGYARASLRRRFWHRAHLEGVRSLSGLQELVLHDPGCMERLRGDLSINVTEMFRDPASHAGLRTAVLPSLRTHPFVRIWVAGCSSGEEVVSVAIALEEQGLLERSRIYATDMDPTILAQARSAAFPLDRLKAYTRNYLDAGGTEEFSRYYTVAGDRAVFDPQLVRDVVFAQHNLATDRSFNEFHLILCRNVLIYFGRELQDHVLGLLDESLVRRGYLALGRKETLQGTALEPTYEPIVGGERIYRRRT